MFVWNCKCVCVLVCICLPPCVHLYACVCLYTSRVAFVVVFYVGVCMHPVIYIVIILHCFCKPQHTLSLSPPPPPPHTHTHKHTHALSLPFSTTAYCPWLTPPFQPRGGCSVNQEVWMLMSPRQVVVFDHCHK